MAARQQSEWWTALFLLRRLAIKPKPAGARPILTDALHSLAVAVAVVLLAHLVFWLAGHHGGGRTRRLSGPFRGLGRRSLWVVSRGNKRLRGGRPDGLRARRVYLLETEETRIVPKKIEFKTDLRRIIEWVLIATLVAIMIYALM